MNEVQDAITEYVMRLRNLEIWAALILVVSVQAFVTIYILSEIGADVEVGRTIVRAYKLMMYAFLAVGFGRPLLELSLEWAWNRWDLPKLEVSR